MPFFFVQTTCQATKTRKKKNSSSTHLDFSTKLMLITVRSFTTTQRLHSFKFTLVKRLFTALADCSMLRRTPFSNLVRMHTCSLIPRAMTTVIALGMRLVLTHALTMYLHAQLARSISVVVGKAHGHHVGKELHSVAYL